MNKRLLTFILVLGTPAVAAIIWMLLPEPLQLEEHQSQASAGNPMESPLGLEKHALPASKSGSAPSKMTRKSDEDFPEPIVEIEPTASTAAAPISPRFLPDSTAMATLPRKDAVNGLGLQPQERIRLLPREAVGGTATSTSNGAGVPSATPGYSAPVKAAGPDAPVALVVDARLHDPAAWVETEEPITRTQATVKEKIADDFAATVAAVAGIPQVAVEEIERVWVSAKEKADLEYRMMFGDDAANRASVRAVESALAGK